MSARGPHPDPRQASRRAGPGSVAGGGSPVRSPSRSSSTTSWRSPKSRSPFVSGFSPPWCSACVSSACRVRVRVRVRVEVVRMLGVRIGGLPCSLGFLRPLFCFRGLTPCGRSLLVGHRRLLLGGQAIALGLFTVLGGDDATVLALLFGLTAARHVDRHGDDYDDDRDQDDHCCAHSEFLSGLKTSCLARRVPTFRESMRNAVRTVSACGAR